MSIEEKMAVMKKHCELICKYKGERQGMKEARKNCAWYVKGCLSRAALSSSKEKIVQVRAVPGRERPFCFYLYRFHQESEWADWEFIILLLSLIHVYCL